MPRPQPLCSTGVYVEPMSESDDIESIRERRRAELLGESAGEESGEDESGTTAAAPDEPIYVRDRAHFEELTGSYDVVLADFYADWCGPCQMLEPIVAEIARDTDAAVVKVDTDAHQDLAMDAGIRGVPTMFLYADGEPVKRMVGLQDASTLRSLVEQFS